VKQVASILLLIILAFNWAGYRLLSGFLEHTAQVALETQIDHSQYEESSLIEIHVPLNAPYLAGNSTDFERFDGEIEIEGTHYNYVKRKILNGELVLLCLPNENKTSVQNSRDEFFKLVNDLNHSTQKSKNTTSFKSFVTEYKQENNSWTINSFTASFQTSSCSSNSFISPGFITVPELPPAA
jgi:hypothetical protein